MTATLTALQAHQQIEQFAQSAPTEVRHIPDGAMAPGKWARQGDIYLVAIDKVPEEFDKPITDRQLAPGNTRGSRHVVVGDVQLFARKSPQDVLEGPVMVLKDRAVVEHPEHAHVSLPAGTIVQVYYQMDARQAERTRSLD